MSRSDSGDGSALPQTASWAKNPQVEQSRRSSQGASRATPSPKSVHARLDSQRPESRASKKGTKKIVELTRSTTEEIGQSLAKLPTPAPQPEAPLSLQRLESAVKTVMASDFSWSLDRSLYDSETLSIIDNFPPLVDENGGAVRYAMKSQQESLRLKEEEERNMPEALSAAEEDDNLASGSLQLGGEPETQDDQGDSQGHFGSGRRDLSQRGFGSISSGPQPFEGQASVAGEFSNLSIGGRSQTPQQRNMSILKASHQHDNVLEQFQRGPATNASLHQPQLSNPFQSQNQQLSALSGHTRQASRYAFANDSATATATVKPANSAQMLAQQAGMMASNQPKQFLSQVSQQSALQNNFYSGVQGPPPGLKSSGTPPISGGGMFGQGHGFASAMGGGHIFGGNLGPKNSNDELMQNFLRSKTGISIETGKREFQLPLVLQQPETSPIPPRRLMPTMVIRMASRKEAMERRTC